MGTKTDNGHIVEHMPQGVYTSMRVYVCVTVSETERDTKTCCAMHWMMINQSLVIQLLVSVAEERFQI